MVINFQFIQIVILVHMSCRRPSWMQLVIDGASLGNYNFKLICRSGKADGDADGFSRRPQENVEIFPDVVKSICQAYKVSRDNCPYAENLDVTGGATIVSSIDSQCDSLESTDISTVDWAHEQLSDVTLRRVIQLLRSGYLPRNNEHKDETPAVSKYFREWNKLSICKNVLYRSTVLNGEQIRQLVLPIRFRDIV